VTFSQVKAHDPVHRLAVVPRWPAHRSARRSAAEVAGQLGAVFFHRFFATSV
jgi:hypothetical protein